MDEHAVLRHPDALLTDPGQHPHPVGELDGVAADVDRRAVDLRHDMVDYLVALADLLATTTGRAMRRAIESARENPEAARPVNRIFELRLADLQQVVDHAVARGELPPVDAYFLAELLTGPVHLYVSRGLRPFTRAEAERITDVVLAGLRHTAG
jgi:AcrR family transcriptional regulator